MECKHCGSKEYFKNGNTNGFHRYNCKSCKRNWTLSQGKAYSMDMRLQALKLYLEGLGFRSIGRILGISNVTVLKWIRAMGENLFQAGALWKNTNVKAVSQIQLDEFWHYTKKKEVSFGFGLLYLNQQNKFLPFFVVNGPKNQQNCSGN